MNRMKQAVHFGAGVIGRGFIGDLLSDSGFEITFVDVDKELLSQINKTNSYDVYYIDRNYERKTIEHVNGISPIDDEEKVIKVISECDILTTSVDRKSTRLNSSHVAISYAVFCFTQKIYIY